MTARHAAIQTHVPVDQLAVDLVRTIAEHPYYRGLMIGAIGPDSYERMRRDFEACDNWENEGGALAYYNR